MVGPVVTRMVVPSGLAPLTALIPISPSPPVRFSTMTLRSSSGAICCARIRHSASPPPPAANGKTIFVSGPDWANASPALADNARLAHPAMKLRRSMFPSPAGDFAHHARLDQSPAFGQIDFGVRCDHSTDAGTCCARVTTRKRRFPAARRCGPRAQKQKSRKQPHAKKQGVAGMDAVAVKNILTRRANHRHISSIAELSAPHGLATRQAEPQSSRQGRIPHGHQAALCKRNSRGISCHRTSAF